MLLEEGGDPRPRIPQDVLAREVVELAGIRHELEQRALVLLQRFVDQPHRVQVGDVHIRRPVQHEQRAHEPIDVGHG